MRRVAERDRPIVSFVLVVYDMPAQAQNTVRSLLPDYQVGADFQDYEVLVVENESGNHVSADFLKTLLVFHTAVARTLYQLPTLCAIHTTSTSKR